jgi:hypothetical protein
MNESDGMPFEVAKFLNLRVRHCQRTGAVREMLLVLREEPTDQIAIWRTSIEVTSVGLVRLSKSEKECRSTRSDNLFRDNRVHVPHATLSISSHV